MLPASLFIDFDLFFNHAHTKIGQPLFWRNNVAIQNYHLAKKANRPQNLNNFVAIISFTANIIAIIMHCFPFMSLEKSRDASRTLKFLLLNCRFGAFKFEWNRWTDSSFGKTRRMTVLKATAEYSAAVIYLQSKALIQCSLSSIGNNIRLGWAIVSVAEVQKRQLYLSWQTTICWVYR